MDLKENAQLKPPRKIFVIILLISLVAFGWFVWPSHYTYTQKRIGVFGLQEIRTDRLTGKHEINTLGAWLPIEISPKGEVIIPPGTLLEKKSQ
jgi:hypothetical protein